MARRRIINSISKERRQLVINCEEMKKDDLFDVEECAEFLKERNKLSRHTQDSLPGGPITITTKKEEYKIFLDVGVDVQKVYFKSLIKLYLYSKGLKDWIRVQISPENGEYGLKYYNLNSE